MITPLFMKGSLHEMLHARAAAARKTAAQYPEDKLRGEGIDVAVGALVGQYTVHKISLRMEEMTAATSEGPVTPRDPFFRGRGTVQGTHIALSVPFDGTPELFQLQPSQYDMNPPRARVADGHVTVIAQVEPGATDGESRVNEARRVLERVGEYARWQHGQVDEFNKQLPSQLIEVLRSRLANIDSTLDTLRKLGIALSPRAGAPSLPIELHQNIKVARGEPAQAPDPVLDEHDYDNILSLIRHQGATFEEAPAAFRALDEEQLRDVIRASLRTVYSSTTAEAFRSNGKTDIAIAQSGRAAFVAECKVWAGGKGLQDALTQLHGYLTWRDCRCAVLIFNKDRSDFAGLLQKIPKELAEHSTYVRPAAWSGAPNEWRVVLHHSAGHEVRCHVMIFDLCQR